MKSHSQAKQSAFCPHLLPFGQTYFHLTFAKHSESQATHFQYYTHIPVAKTSLFCCRLFWPHRGGEPETERVGSLSRLCFTQVLLLLVRWFSLEEQPCSPSWKQRTRTSLGTSCIYYLQTNSEEAQAAFTFSATDKLVPPASLHSSHWFVHFSQPVAYCESTFDTKVEYIVSISLCNYVVVFSWCLFVFFKIADWSPVLELHILGGDKFNSSCHEVEEIKFGLNWRRF